MRIIILPMAVNDNDNSHNNDGTNSIDRDKHVGMITTAIIMFRRQSLQASGSCAGKWQLESTNIVRSGVG